MRFDLTKLRYFGFKFKCPFCNSHLRRLKPVGMKFPVLIEKNVVGGGYRYNARCPVCRSTDRERLVYLYLLKKTNLFNEKVKVLHIAPESRISRIIKSHADIDYLTADLRRQDVMVRMDITQINYPAESFDVIICNHVMEHIVDDRKAMTELCRVLKSDGWAIIQVPISLSLEKTYEDFSVTKPSEREAKFGQSDHVRIYAMDYVDRLSESGFEVEQFNWQEDTEFSAIGSKYGLLPSENVFVLNKVCPV